MLHRRDIIGPSWPSKQPGGSALPRAALPRPQAVRGAPPYVSGGPRQVGSRGLFDAELRWVVGGGPVGGLGDGTGLNLNKFDRETMAPQSDRNFKDAPSAYNTFFTTVARRYRSGFWCLRNPIIADADTGHGGITATMKCLGS